VPLPLVVARTNFTTNEDPRANELVTVPLGLVVWAVLLRVAALTATGVVPPDPEVTVKVADATLLTASVTDIVVFPAAKPVGIVMKAMKLGPVGPIGAVVTIAPPTWTNTGLFVWYPLPMI